MVKVHKTIKIHAPVDRVFAFLTDPHNLPEIWPSMVEVKNVIRAAGGGYNFGWLYKMAGMKFEGASEATEFVLNQRHSTKSTKGIESKFTWVYQREDNDTRLTVDIEYKVPVPLIGKIAEAIILKQNEHEADALLENLKNRMEIVTPIAA
jgi:uncharacterized membrane protein